MKTARLLMCALFACVAAFAAPENGACNCYYSSDCSAGTCGGYGSCGASGKNDGTCSTVGLSIRENPIAISTAIDYYFKAFGKAIENGGGHPDADLAKAAEAVPLSTGGHNLVEYTVWVSLDAVMGWDFMYPSSFLRTSGFLGNIREVNGVSSAAGLVDATRQGLINAVRSGNANDAAKPVEAFWVSNPAFTPHHLGRCYPHGHDEVTPGHRSSVRLALWSDWPSNLSSPQTASSARPPLPGSVE